MKVSKNLLTNSYNVPESHFFATREERNMYFMTNSYGDHALCAINSTGESVENTDPYAAVWDLELFNGINWVLQSVDTNYAMVITNEGLKALAYVNESQGGYKIRISGIKCKSTHIISNENLAQWTDEIFSRDGDVVLDTTTGENATFTVDNNLTWRFNMANGGIQYCVTIDNSTIGILNGNKLYDYTVGAVALYVPNPEHPENRGADVLFAIANLDSDVAKYATTVKRIGNSIKLYLNTTLSNLGYVSDVKVLPSDVGSIPEVGTEDDLQLYAQNECAPYNLYLVNNLYSTNTPALAIRSGSPVDDTLGWTFFSPSDDVIRISEEQANNAVLKDYMIAAWDPDSKTYIPADGSNDNLQTIGVKVGNTLLFAGKIANKNWKYHYSHEIKNPGSGYEYGDKLRYTENNQTFTITVTNVGKDGSVLSVNVVASFGNNELSDGAIVENLTYFTNGAGTGSNLSLLRHVQENITESYNWNFPESWMNQPLYIDSGENAGKITNKQTNDSNQANTFLGWCTNYGEMSTIKLALDLRNDASEVNPGITRYATEAETWNVKQNVGAGTMAAVVPAHLQKNYLLITRNKDSEGNYVDVGNPGETKDNPIVVDTHVKFNQTVIGKGVADMPSNVTYDANVSFFGLAYRAWWGDLAEFYESDEIYEPGTLITIGDGKAEITKAKTECNGIISTAPGYELGEKKSAYDLPVALVGKVPVLMSKDCVPEFGDRIYLSRTEAGKASTVPNGRCLGKIIEKHPNLNQKSSVMCSVKISF